MTKFFKKSLMILAVILIMLLSVSSIHAEDGTDTGDVLTNDGDDVQIPIGNGTDSGNEGPDSGSGGVTPAGNGSGESGSETPSGNGTESGNGTGNGTGETPSGNGTESGNGTGNGTGASAEVLTFSDLQRLINSGNYTLNNDFKFNYDTDFSFLRYEGVQIKSRDITIKGNGHYLDGNGVSKIFWIYNSAVTLEDVILQNGYTSDDYGKLYQNHYNGGAVYLSHDSTLTVKRCTFKNNRVYNANGAAIYTNKRTGLYIYNSQFLDNKAERNSPLPWTSYKRGMGGTLLVGIGSTLKIENTDFKRNTAYVSVIVIASYDDKDYALSTATLKNCLFESNSATNNGVFYLDELSKGYFTNCTFKNNKAQFGSILRLDAALDAKVTNCNFEGNTAINGAINLGKFDGKVGSYVNSVSKVTIEGTTFKNNKATESGGAIFSNSGILTIKKCIFDGNKADKIGGAIYANQYGTLKLYDTTFKNNYAKLYGGAIFAPIKTLSKVVDSNCVYKNNKAGKGAAHVYGVFSVKVTKVSSNYGSVVLKAKVSTPWKLLKTQKVGFKLVKGSKEYYSSVKKINSKGEVIQKVPGKIKLGKYKAYAFSHEGANYAKALSLTVTKAPCKVVLKKTTIKYKTSIVKGKLMNTKSKCIVSGAKLKVKVIAKWGSFSYIATASGDGVVKISTGKLSKGKYTLQITSADKNIKLKKFSAKIKIK